MQCGPGGNRPERLTVAGPVGTLREASVGPRSNALGVPSFADASRSVPTGLGGSLA